MAKKSMKIKQQRNAKFSGREFWFTLLFNFHTCLSH